MKKTIINQALQEWADKQVNIALAKDIAEQNYDMPDYDW